MKEKSGEDENKSSITKKHNRVNNKVNYGRYYIDPVGSRGL